MMLGEPLPKRLMKIAEFARAKESDNTWGIHFQGKLRYFSIFKVPIDFPKYRIDNGRTLAAQQEWLAKHKDLPKDLFSNDFESIVAQTQQHEILKTMVDKEGLLSHFETTAQEEPIVLSDKGFVVNGNRRLCAWRMLFDADRLRYKHFSHVDVIVLPAASEKEIYELEVELQIKPDIQAKYSWVHRAMMLKRGREMFDFSDDELADIHGLKAKEVRELISLLDYADLFLAARKKPKEYNLVEDKEFALKKHKEGREGLKDEGDRLIWDSLNYVVLDRPTKGRKYDVIPRIKENFEKIVSRLPKEIKVQSAAVTTSPDLDLLGAVAPAKIALAAAADQAENREAVHNVIMDVLQAEDRHEKDHKKANFALERVRNANTFMGEAFNTLTPNSSTAGMEEQLDSVEDFARKIRTWLKDNV